MRKVFIVGAHRSGTSKLASYFQDILRFSGHGEGHIYRLLSHLKNGKADIIRTIPENAYEVNRIGFDRIFEAVVQALDRLISEHHGHRDYFDKTPGYRMLDAAPLLHRHLPEARFIHLKRNGIDNVHSNLRLWPDRHFDDACRMWASSVNAYLSVREAIADRLLDLDMTDLLERPWETHLAITGFLGLEDPSTEDAIRSYFAAGSNTSTRDPKLAARAPRLADQSWTEAEKATFVQICGPAMDRLGYAYV